MLGEIVVLVASLVGFASLFALLINIAKWLGWVQEGQAAKISAGANLVLVLVAYGFKLFNPEFDFLTIDPIIEEAATVGMFIFTYILQLFGSQFTHETVKGLPVIGKSFSLEQEKDIG